MANRAVFGEVLEAVEELTVEEQETLVEIVNRRMLDRRRAQLAEDVKAAQRDYQDGACKPTTPDDLMREILS